MKIEPLSSEAVLSRGNYNDNPNLNPTPPFGDLGLKRYKRAVVASTTVRSMNLS
jgi:hypothetical protein